MNKTIHIEDGRLEHSTGCWKSIRHNDKDALLWIYKTYAELLLGYGIGLCRDREMVKDAIQEVFVSLWKSRHHLNGIDNIKAYLYKSLRTQLTKMQKPAGNRVQDSALQVAIFEDHECRMIEEEHQHQLRVRLNKGIALLPHREREVIRNLFFENLSYEETSYIMEINVRSVYTLAWKAVSRLKKHLHFFLIIQYFSL